MKIFISWSGDRSGQVAELLSTWIQCVLQAIDPWLSSKDIDRGSLWFSEITSQLSTTQNGIVCLTKSNLNKPWILFESGALAKGLSSSRVYTFLIDLSPNDIKDPLAQFNHTLPTRDGVYQLIRTINNNLEAQALKESILSNVFDTYWPQFDKSFKQIMKDTKDEEIIVERPKEDILNEILYSVRGLDKRVRVMEEESMSIDNRQLRGRRVRNPYLIPIEDFDLSVRSINALKILSINNLDDFLKLDKEKMRLLNDYTREEVRMVIEKIL
ncbi:MAG: DNA-directed RNA polymerase subunit alpha C-terminal domain-containing protein [Bacteroidota bacterium]